jgi:hypothetical protein
MKIAGIQLAYEEPESGDEGQQPMGTKEDECKQRYITKAED